MKYFFLLIFFYSLNTMSQKVDYQYIRPELRPKTMNRNQIFKGQVKEVKCTNQYFNKNYSETPDYVYWKFDQIGNLVYFSFIMKGKSGDRYIHLFDKNNNLASSEWYNEITSELYTKTNYKYDDSSRLESVEEFNKIGELKNIKKYFYKNRDKPYEIHYYQKSVDDLSKSTEYDNQELWRIDRLEYDKSNNLIKVEHLDENKELGTTLKFAFDEKDRCIKESIYLPELGHSYSYKFNDEENSITFYNFNNGIKEKVRYNKYNEGKLISISTYDRFKILSIEEYKYDDKGNLISVIKTEDGKESSKMEKVYTLDKFDNPLTIDIFLNDIKIESKTYEFEYYL